MLEYEKIALAEDFPFRIRREVIPSTQTPFEHWHRPFEITLVERGVGQYDVAARCYRMQKGDLIVFNSAEPHGWQALFREIELLVIVFDPEFVQSGETARGADYLRPFVDRTPAIKTAWTAKTGSPRCCGICSTTSKRNGPSKVPATT
jgi:quercetin dioxygenase-like cupin family protein